MAGFGKWVGGAIGWALGGPIGGILGYQVGKLFSSGDQISQGGARGFQSRTTRSGDFAMALVVLSAAVMQADGKVLKSELDFVKNFLKLNFGSAQADQLLLLLREALKQQVDVRGVASQIRFNMDHPKRLLLLQYLYGISKSDGHVDKSEIDLIRTIASHLGISLKDIESIEEPFHSGSLNPYKVLEITDKSTDSEVKKAYRRLAIKFHPDKIGDLGEGPRQKAKERFLQVQEAYEQIKKSRGFK
ncbi:MAG TPA: molecular chaperone DjiA [Flavobacteriales bacterium]|jgi:DnaJ like chaperone protein|nr:molecular chaperone DjiA [Flavobacteriales bacterium]HIB76695.1 molecular chaperone DjiA [Flavobacteriales bacterium]HIN42134.1 molecular chaperone DjiA [Flavobacteriales bacterium]